MVVIHNLIITTNLNMVQKVVAGVFIQLLIFWTSFTIYLCRCIRLQSPIYEIFVLTLVREGATY
jgi:hypothetical protein